MRPSPLSIVRAPVTAGGDGAKVRICLEKQAA